LLLSASLLAQTPEPIGDEFQINTYTTNFQFSPRVASGPPGSFVVVWDSYGSDGTDTSLMSVQAQRVYLNGSLAGEQFQVNSYTLGDQDFAAVTMSPSGDFVVVWASGGSYGNDAFQDSIQGQLFNATGAPLGGQFQINSYTPNNQALPAVASDASGNFVAVWVSFGSSGTDSDLTSILGQLFEADGDVVGNELQVNSYTTDHQRFPAVAMDASGNFVVVWESKGSYGSDTSSYSIQGQRFNAAGAPVGNEFQVNSFTTLHQRYPEVAMDSAGDFVVVWESSRSYTDYDNSIQGQRFVAGNPFGDQFLVNSYIFGDQQTPAVAVEPAGEFTVVWQSHMQDGSSWGVLGQRFDNGGVPQGAEFAVNTYTTLEQKDPVVTIASPGDFVVVWESEGSYGTDTSFTSIQGQRLSTTLIFSDSFETSDTSGWSSSVP